MTDDPNQPSEIDQLAYSMVEAESKRAVAAHVEGTLGRMVDDARAEVRAKVERLIKGGVLGVLGLILTVLALLVMLQALAWGIWSAVSNNNAEQIWLGFGIVAAVLLLCGLFFTFVGARILTPAGEPAVEEPSRAEPDVRAELDEIKAKLARLETTRDDGDDVR